MRDIRPDGAGGYVEFTPVEGRDGVKGFMINRVTPMPDRVVGPSEQKTKLKKITKASRKRNR
jgi:hypothetical protein